MLFNVEEDSGNRIVGYFVPDSYSAVPKILVSSHDVEIAAIDANIVRPGLVAAGRHETGLCGFELTTAILPSLADTVFLELQEATSPFAFYRRRPQDLIVARKVFRLETSQHRLRGFDKVLSTRFCSIFTGADRFGRETMVQTLNLISVNSLYLSARLLYKEHEHSISGEMSSICVLQDPFTELAETLLGFSKGSPDNGSVLSLRDELSSPAMVDFAQSLDMRDADTLRRTLRAIPAEVEGLLENPLARILAARTSEETSNLSYIASALVSLSSFDIIGVEEEPNSFIEPIAELLQLDSLGIQFSPAPAEAIDLARTLREMDEMHYLVELDLEIYRQVTDALAISSSG